MPNLFPYQIKGRDFLAARPRAGIWDDMRLGKTRQILSAAKLLTVDTAIIVCKASGKYVWESESLEWGFNPLLLNPSDTPQRKRINILSYNASITGLFDRLINMRSVSLVVADESHYLTNLKSQRTLAFYGKDACFENSIAGLGANVWVATGTPAPNNPSELYPCIRGLFPDLMISKRTGNPASYWQFVGRYCKTIDNAFGWKIVGGKNLPELRSRLVGRVLRRTKQEVWKEVPATIRALLPIQAQLPVLPVAEKKVLEKRLSEGKNTLSALESISGSMPTLRRMIGLAKVKGVISWVQDNIDELGKVILFAFHKAVIDQLVNEFKNQCAVITGGISPIKRKAAYEKFLNDKSCRIFIGQNHAAGDSIPLHSASTCLLIEPEWVPRQNDQCIDRMLFHTKREPCTAYYVTVPGSLDEDINKAISQKNYTLKRLGL